MKPISDLVKYYGSLRKTGKVLGPKFKNGMSVKRWKDAGALIDNDGAVWIKTAQTEWRGEE